jgi:DNA replication ATP-dependent helicase Dna2
MILLDKDQAEQFYLRLREIVADSADAKTKLLLIRQLLESIYKRLSEGSKVSFSGLFARTQYVHTQCNTPARIVAQVNKLRILCNKVAHEDGFTPAGTDFSSAVLALRELLLWVNGEVTDPAVESFLQTSNARQFEDFKASSKHTFTCVVSSWDLLQNNGVNAGIRIEACNEDGTSCTLILNDLEAEGTRWSSLGKVLWQYCSLHCINTTEIAGREQCFTSNPQTLLVVEPDFLIDISSLSECFTNQGTHPEYFILSRMVREASAEKAMQGNMVNNILDELISHPETDYQTLFQQSMARQPISLIALGKESALNIYHTIQNEHFDKIRAFATSLKEDPVQLEPSYLSPEYGLQGRLDLLHEHGGKQNIVELKSGKPPQYDVWISQKMQVTGYNMIIRDCYSLPCLGTSSILYSAAEENNLRHVVTSLAQEQSLLMCRNRIVGILHNLAIDPLQFFNWLKGCDYSGETGFMQSTLKGIVSTLKTLEEHEFEWFLEQVRLLMREIWFEKTGGLGRESIYGHNALWQESITAKRNRYKVLDSLKLISVDFNRTQFSLSDKQQITDFRKGDIVILYRQKTPIQKQEILRGQIILLDEDKVEVQIRGGFRSIEPKYLDDLWAIEHDILETSLYSPLSSLFAFLQADESKRELCLGIRKPESDNITSPGIDTIEDIVERIAVSRDYHIIQGPPGTGKTSGLLTSYLNRIYSSTEKNVLILSYTNRAVDEICLNLQKHNIPFIRTGQSEEVESELMDNLIRGKKYDEISSLLKSYRVWVATVQSCNAWFRDLLKIISIDELVIDEASQIVENSIMGLIGKADKIVLIGDQNQLPPITHQTDQSFDPKNEKLSGLFYGAYNQSLMERLYKVCEYRGWDNAITMLHNHYRMHSDIADLVQKYYKGKLVCRNPRQHEELHTFDSELLSSRLLWIECPPSQHAYYDPLQVRCILHILNTLTSYHVVHDIASEVGIVVPFRAMIHALQNELPPEQKGITIDTVERFQGSERQTIIISLPLHNAMALRNIEALSHDALIDRKLNVAVSRAQERLIILGNAGICQRSTHYKLLLDKINSRGKVIPLDNIITGE